MEQLWTKVRNSIVYLNKIFRQFEKKKVTSVQFIHIYTSCLIHAYTILICITTVYPWKIFSSELMKHFDDYFSIFKWRVCIMAHNFQFKMKPSQSYQILIHFLILLSLKTLFATEAPLYDCEEPKCK